MAWGMPETLSLYRTLLIGKLYLARGCMCFVPVTALVYSFSRALLEIHHF